MKITSVQARQIFNSRGMPTLECYIALEDGHTVSASVPSGASKGKHETIEWPEVQNSESLEERVDQAREIIETIIAPALIGREPNLLTIDTLLIDLDGSPSKTRAGANTLLAVSSAVARAHALMENVELYELFAYLVGFTEIRLPLPWFNMLNGGVHAHNGIPIQEFMVLPIQATSFKQAYQDGILFFQTLRSLLIKKGLGSAVGDEGGFAPMLQNERDMFALLVETLQEVDFSRYQFAIDVAASQLYDPKLCAYQWSNNERLTAPEMIEYYAALIEALPLIAIEDGLAEDDWAHWSALSQALEDKCLLIGDDLTCTNINRIKEAAALKAINTVIIKPNQIGTLTETLQAIQICKELNLKVIISHRSGETLDTLIADLAVGTNAQNIKAGGCSRGERIAKYNRLLSIEEQLSGGFLSL